MQAVSDKLLQSTSVLVFDAQVSPIDSHTATVPVPSALHWDAIGLSKAACVTCLTEPEHFLPTRCFAALADSSLEGPANLQIAAGK